MPSQGCRGASSIRLSQREGEACSELWLPGLHSACGHCGLQGNTEVAYACLGNPEDQWLHNCRLPMIRVGYRMLWSLQETSVSRSALGLHNSLLVCRPCGHRCLGADTRAFPCRPCPWAVRVEHLSHSFSVPFALYLCHTHPHHTHIHTPYSHTTHISPTHPHIYTY